MNLIPGAASSSEKAVLEQAAYQTSLYLPLHKWPPKKRSSLGTIIQTAYDEYETLSDNERLHLDALNEVCSKYPEFKTAQLVDPSWDNAEKYDPEGFRACTFSRDGQLNVCFRGTPEGAWVDNGLAMTGVVDAEYLEAYECDGTVINMSAMQLCAVKYMEEAIADNKKNLPICVSGHSKGGNETQLVTVLLGEHIEAAYSFDGQGFPPEIIEQFKKLDGYEDNMDKILGINADNDYVHGLGQQIIPEENVVYIQTPGADQSDLLDNHYITAILTVEYHLGAMTIRRIWTRRISPP